MNQVDVWIFSQTFIRPAMFEKERQLAAVRPCSLANMWFALPFAAVVIAPEAVVERALAATDTALWRGSRPVYPFNVLSSSSTVA